MKPTPLPPDLLTFNNSSLVATPQDWPTRLAELLPAMLDLEYGGMPPAITAQGRLLARSPASKIPFPAAIEQHHIIVEGEKTLAFHMDLMLPIDAQSPCPVLITGDGCWRCFNDTTKKMILDQGYALAVFNRTQIIPDVYHTHDQRTGDLYDVFPGQTFGAIAAWAWGYHRCIDVLATLPAIDASRIAVSGHSRGGKAALLAGATDSRIALTNANNSGCCGAGCHHVHGDQCERLENILKSFPFWFGPKLADYIGRDADLPFDQHILKAAIAPRLLLTTEALGDHWANPVGTWHSHQAAQPAFNLLGASDHLAIHYRPGEHAQTSADIAILLAFMGLHWQNKPLSQPLNANPFAS